MSEQSDKSGQHSSITLCDGKYEFYRDAAGLLCKRHGEPWRDFLGDKAISALFEYALEMRQKSYSDEYLDQSQRQAAMSTPSATASVSPALAYQQAIRESVGSILSQYAADLILKRAEKIQEANNG